MSIMRVKQQDGTTVDIPLGKGGHNGADGVDGKSAYEYAQEGGFEGTEEEFAEKLASDYVKSVNGTLPDENGDVVVDVGDGAVETVVEITLTEAVTSFIYKFTNEERAKINSAKKVAISYNIPNSGVEIKGVTFGIYYSPWSSYTYRIVNNSTLPNYGEKYACAVCDLAFKPPIIIQTVSGLSGLTANTTSAHMMNTEGVIQYNGSELRLVTTGENPFPVGTVIKVEVVS